jgi:hypothetical protein
MICSFVVLWSDELALGAVPDHTVAGAAACSPKGAVCPNDCSGIPHAATTIAKTMTVVLFLLQYVFMIAFLS